MNKAVFIDRDGTLNIEKDYLYLPSEFEFIDGAVKALKMFGNAGYLVIVVSNQSGVARGYYTEEDVYNLHRYVDDLLFQAGAAVHAWFYCPHHLSGKGSYALPCKCRKPEPGMLLEASARFNIDMESSYMIGDKLIDLDAGRKAGCKESILVRTGYGAKEEAMALNAPVCDDILAAARLICSGKI